jgi:hypothetical protein
MAKKKVEVPRLVVESKVKEYAKSLGDVNIGSGFVDALSNRVGHIIADSISRCQGNGRKTLRDVDL